MGKGGNFLVCCRDLCDTLSGADFSWDIYQKTKPEIHPQLCPVDKPLSGYFLLHTSSKYFRMKIMEVQCSIRKIIAGDNTPDHQLFSDFAIENNPVSMHGRIINPGEDIQYHCPLKDILHFDSPVTKATIRIIMNYKVTRFERTPFYSQTFNWDADSRQWREGEDLY